MSHILDTEKYLDTAVALLNEGKTNIPVPIVGTSMRPFLKEGDTAFLSPLVGSVRKGDIVLFLRPNGSYVLHRVSRKPKNGIIMTLGDNQLTEEPVPEEKILAEATSAKRSGKLIGKKSPTWRFFSGFYLRFSSLRPYFSILIK